MNKRVAFGTKPAKSEPPASLDELVQSRREGAAAEAEEAASQATRRMSVDLPIPLHTKLKLHCVQNDMQIADFVRDLIRRALGEIK
jgi:hypothetical protein